MVIWVITRFPGNPITGNGSRVNEMAMIVEAMQGAFIGLAAAILVIESQMKNWTKRPRQTRPETYLFFYLVFLLSSCSIAKASSKLLLKSPSAPSSNSVVLRCFARSVTVIMPTNFPPSIIGSRRIL